MLHNMQRNMLVPSPDWTTMLHRVRSSSKGNGWVFLSGWKGTNKSGRSGHENTSKAVGEQIRPHRIMPPTMRGLGPIRTHVHVALSKRNPTDGFRFSFRCPAMLQGIKL